MTGKNEDGRRQRRVAETLRAELSMLLVRELNDPVLAFVNVTGVECSPDLKHARVFFSLLNQDTPDRAHAALTRAAVRLQRELGKRLKLRYTPVLRFVFDATFREAGRIDALIIESQRELTLREKSLSTEEQLGRIIASTTRILLTTHRGPDADAAGSLLGLGRMLTLMGRSPVLFSPDALPAALGRFCSLEDIAQTLSPQDIWELTIVLDTGGISQLPDGFPEPSRRGRLVVIDHHAAHDDFGDLVIREQCSSTGELLYRLARKLAWPVDRTVAQCLYAAMAGDTGSFRFDNTKPETHRAAAELIELGAAPWETATALFESLTLAGQKLLGLAALTLEVTQGGRLAEMICTRNMMAQVDATDADAEGLSNFGRTVDGVEISVVYAEDGCGNVRLSFRGAGDVDVSQLAARFGGGGHRSAAGATICDQTIESLRPRVTDAVSQVLTTAPIP